MKSLLLLCPVCSSRRQEVLFDAFTRPPNGGAAAIDAFQSIVLCEACGAVFRNPIVPDLNQPLYQAPDHWGDEEDHRRFDERLRHVSQLIRKNVALQDGDWMVDIGGGPGWLIRRLNEIVPGLRAVLCEPSAENGKFARRQLQGLTAIPSRFDEFDAPAGFFDLVTATGVDYLFIDHRGMMQKVDRLLRPGGSFYVERNVFVEQEAYYRQPIFDHEDLFGINHMMNFWPGRQQFVEYLSTFFETREPVEYDFGETLGYRCRMLGVFCIKASRPSSTAEPKNYYSQHLAALQERATRSSVTDLKSLATSGLKRVSVVGDVQETNRLKELIEAHRLFEIVPVEQLSGSGNRRKAWWRTSKPMDPPDSAEAVFIASVASQGDYRARLAQQGFTGRLLPCFRQGYDKFEITTSAGNRIQMKAFLPGYLSRSQPEAR
jgi:hypothetical protein